MVTPTFTSPRQEIARDHLGRPLVIPTTGGKPVPYTRCTTFVGVVEDLWKLQQWDKRMVALGLSMRPDLLLAVSAHRDDKNRLDKITEEAKEAAKATAKATIGTAVHALTEQLDLGQELPELPTEYAADIDAYRIATAPLKAVLVEPFTVLDALQIGGTPDRVVQYAGKRYIADVKTGNIDWAILKIAMQLAVYSRSQVYDVNSGARSPHNAELDKGIIIHLPAGEGSCELVWVDLLAGWEAVRVARDVREKRKIKYADLTEPFGQGVPVFGRTEETGATELVSVVSSLPPEPTLAELIVQCPTSDTVRNLWSLRASEWTEEHTTIAKEHIARLEGPTP